MLSIGSDNLGEIPAIIGLSGRLPLCCLTRRILVNSVSIPVSTTNRPWLNAGVYFLYADAQLKFLD
jgi:hypothetical protein